VQTEVHMNVCDLEVVSYTLSLEATSGERTACAVLSSCSGFLLLRPACFLCGSDLCSRFFTQTLAAVCR
jgi:hypothetical protein